ncbi:MAG: hypothetical protein GY719_13745 [bacterium]|nr:hypothetical protein [bacterium]
MTSFSSAGRRWLAFLLAVVLWPATGWAEQRDPKAVELAESVLEAMGGEEHLPDSVFESAEPVAAD